jgi:hypothetical protein
VDTVFNEEEGKAAPDKGQAGEIERLPWIGYFGAANYSGDKLR